MNSKTGAGPHISAPLRKEVAPSSRFCEGGCETLDSAPNHGFSLTECFN